MKLGGAPLGLGAVGIVDRSTPGGRAAAITLVSEESSETFNTESAKIEQRDSRYSTMTLSKRNVVYTLAVPRSRPRAIVSK